MIFSFLAGFPGAAAWRFNAQTAIESLCPLPFPGAKGRRRVSAPGAGIDGPGPATRPGGPVGN